MSNSNSLRTIACFCTIVSFAFATRSAAQHSTHKGDRSKGASDLNFDWHFDSDSLERSLHDYFSGFGDSAAAWSLGEGLSGITVNSPDGEFFLHNGDIGTNSIFGTGITVESDGVKIGGDNRKYYIKEAPVAKQIEPNELHSHGLDKHTPFK